MRLRLALDVSALLILFYITLLIAGALVVRAWNTVTHTEAEATPHPSPLHHRSVFSKCLQMRCVGRDHRVVPHCWVLGIDQLQGK